MNLPIDAIEECIEDANAENDGWCPANGEENQRRGTEQLKALLDYIAKLEDEIKEQAECIAESTFGGWYG